MPLRSSDGRFHKALLAAATLLVMLATANPGQTAEPADPSAEQHYDCTMYRIVQSGPIGMWIRRIEGAITYRQHPAILHISSEPWETLLWEPRAEGIPSPLRDIGALEAELRRAGNGQWEVVQAKLTPPSGEGPRDAAEGAVLEARMLLAGLSTRSVRDTAILDTATLTDSAPFKAGEAAFDSLAMSDAGLGMGNDKAFFDAFVVLERAKGLLTSIVVVRQEKARTIVALGDIWAGGAKYDGDRSTLAHEGASRVVGFVSALGPESDAVETQAAEFLKQCAQWHQDVDIRLYLCVIGREQDTDGAVQEAGKPPAESEQGETLDTAAD